MHRCVYEVCVLVCTHEGGVCVCVCVVCVAMPVP